jgi:CDP-glucose 4,6-dehydratase
VALRRDADPGARFVSDGIEGRCIVALADLVDFEALVRVLNEHEVKTVFHLGAQTIVGTALRAPLATFDTNIRGTYALLEACRSLGDGAVERIVVASTDKAYGAQDELPYREDFALRATYPYDVSKACVDLIARSYAATYALPVAVTRFANVYGPGDVNWSRLVPDTARALVHGERPVIRSDGTPERDYLYVDDAVEAYLVIAGSLDRPDLHGRAWNAGWGRGVSVLELVRRLIAVSGAELEPDVHGARVQHAEIDRQFLDSTAIRSELGWEPRVGLDDGLAAAWEWYRERLG